MRWLSPDTEILGLLIILTVGTLHRSVSLSPQTITAITAAGREPDAGIAQWPAAVAAMPSVAARRARSVPLAALSRAFVADPEMLVPGGKARARQLGRRSGTQPAPAPGNLQQTIDESLTAVAQLGTLSKVRTESV